ncbi:MAG TPA: hypothetical protein VMT00_13440 [Thermoanaerobaculia bacterium]|nr:hypothetical protein [Thermoanaerobaculia bacterium]
MNAILLVHVITATAALISGYAALVFRKGSAMHGAVGSVFVVSMLAMSASAVVLATFYSHVAISVVVGLLTFYLVTTAWRAIRPSALPYAAFDLVAAAFVAAVGLLAFTFGADAAFSRNGTRDGFPALIYVVFGSIAVLFAASDVRVFVRPQPLPQRRVGRHLFRMTLALLLASLSFYPGQAQLFPTWLRATNLLMLPHVFVLGSMAWWMARVARSKSAAAVMSET